MPLPLPPLTIAPLDGSWAVYDATGKRLGILTDEGFAQAVVKLPELVSALADVVAAEMGISYADFTGNRNQQIAATAVMNVALERAQTLLTTIRNQ